MRTQFKLTIGEYLYQGRVIAWYSGPRLQLSQGCGSLCFYRRQRRSERAQYRQKGLGWSRRHLSESTFALRRVLPQLQLERGVEVRVARSPNPPVATFVLEPFCCELKYHWRSQVDSLASLLPCEGFWPALSSCELPIDRSNCPFTPQDFFNDPPHPFTLRCTCSFTSRGDAQICHTDSRQRWSQTSVRHGQSRFERVTARADAVPRTLGSLSSASARRL